MGSKKSSNNLYKEWNEAHENVCFYTRSPFPEQDYFFSPEPLPHCSNSACWTVSHFKYDEIIYYIKEQLAILKFNNPDMDAFSLISIFKLRILNWKDNEQLKELLNEFNHMDMVDEAVDIVLDSNDVSKFIDMNYTKHWYSDKIENLPSRNETDKWGERRREKLRLRSTFANQKGHEKIKESSEKYQNENFGIQPTIKDIKDITGMSVYEIKTYGEGLFLNKSENTKQRILKYLELFTDLTYKEIAEKFNVAERTIKRYSKSAK